MLLKSALVVFALTLAELGFFLYASARFNPALFLPGLLTGLVGLMLFVGPVRGDVTFLLGSRLASLLPAGALDGRSFRRRGGVVDVTSTMKHPARSAASPAHLELG